MDHQSHAGQQRELVYCHGCENEWYRAEHGLVCPECDSDFTEIIEHDRDPRQDDAPSASNDDDPPFGDHHHGNDDFYAPDPDEDDIGNLQWEQTAPGRFRVHGSMNTTYSPSTGYAQGGMGGGLMGLIGGVLQNITQQPQHEANQRAISPSQERTPGPGSPLPEQHPQMPPGNGTFVRSGGGPGFSWTVASTSNTNFGGPRPGLFPRNPHMPQPFQTQPDHIDAMLQQMIMNIGAMPGGAFHVVGTGGPPGEDPFTMHRGTEGGAGGDGARMHPLMGLLNLFGPLGGQMGDAVYSQEALDRVVSQLMEQHQSGNAPGPATEAAIESLPTKQITEKDMSDSGRADCSICMDEVPLGSTVTLLPCNHWFHADCIRAWLREHDTCPHCRQGIMPKESERGNNSRARQSSQAPMNDMNSPEYTRPSVTPGAYPFPPQSPTTGVMSPGTEQNPFVVPDSPTSPRRASTNNRRMSGMSSGTSMFSRMREAFGRSSSNNGNPTGEQAEHEEPK